MIRGRFHKAKKFLITKIIFVITNVSNFFSQNLRDLNCSLRFQSLLTNFVFVNINNVCNTNKFY